jgi:hypothetical protein
MPRDMSRVKVGEQIRKHIFSEFCSVRVPEEWVNIFMKGCRKISNIQARSNDTEKKNVLSGE